MWWAKLSLDQRRLTIYLQNTSWPSAKTNVWKNKKVGLEFQEQFFTSKVSLKMKMLGEYMEGKQD